MPDLSVQVTCNSAKYWVAIDDYDMVDQATNKSPHTFPVKTHLLTWWIEGAIADTITITVTSSDGKKFNVPKGTTFPNKVIGAGYFEFED